MTKFEEKQELLKNSVSLGKRIPFVADVDAILYWWDIINDVIFDGELYEPKHIVVKRFRDNIGWCQPYRFNNKKNRRVRIGINRTLNNLHDFLCVILHEMVHQWQWEHLGVWDDNVMHGKSFYEWHEIIMERSGAPLAKTYIINGDKTLAW